MIGLVLAAGLPGPALQSELLLAPPGIAEAVGGPPDTTVPVLEKQPPNTERRWYGYQLVISDVASALVAGAGYALASGASAGDSGGDARVYGSILTSVGAAGLVLVPPLIHLLHRQYSEAAWSFGLRALPAALIIAAAASGGQAGATYATIGLIGLLVAILIDDALLAWDSVPISPRPAVEPTSALTETRRGTLAFSLGVGF